MCFNPVQFTYWLWPLILLLVGQEAMATNPRMTITNPLAGKGIRVIDPGSPQFAGEINQLLDTQAAARTTALLGRSVVVVNESASYVWGFTVVFTFPDMISPSGNPRRHVISPSPGGAAPLEALLPPGGRLLITPVPHFLASRQPSGQRSLRPRMDDDMERMIQKFVSDHPSDQEQIKVSLDSVIFEDGTIEGPDTAGTKDKVNSRIKAHQDFVAALNGLKGKDLQAKLSELSNAEEVDAYTGRLKDLALLFQEKLKRNGENDVLQDLQRLKLEHWFPDPGLVRRKAQ